MKRPFLYQNEQALSLHETVKSVRVKINFMNRLSKGSKRGSYGHRKCC